MVRDVAAPIQFYQLLGFEPAFRDAPVEPKYAGVRRDGVELHLQWHGAKDFSQGDRPTYRFVVPEACILGAQALRMAACRRSHRRPAWARCALAACSPTREHLRISRCGSAVAAHWSLTDTGATTD